MLAAKSPGYKGGTLLLAVFSLAALIAAGSANSAFPGRNGVIAAAHAGDIWTLDKNDHHVVDLTNTPTVVESDPAWSADGQRIAFVKDGDEIWTMNANGTDQRQVVAAIPDVINGGNIGLAGPSWSPEGSKIIFEIGIGARSSGNSSIASVNVNGTQLTILYLGEPAQFNEDPVWSPNGTQIAFTHLEPSGALSTIFTMNPDGSGASPLIPEESSVLNADPDWSPDSSSIAFTHCAPETACDIESVKADGSGRVDLTNTPDASEAQPAWLPDGKQIVYVRNGNLWTMKADGRKQDQLTTDGGYSAPDWQPLQSPRLSGK